MGISNGPWVKGGTSGRQDDFVAQVDDQLIWWVFFWFTLELWVLSAMPENLRHLAVHACLLFPLSFGLIRVQVHC